MAHLTRTQKYAQLSQEVANDKEQSTSTKQLADLEQRLKNITDTLSTPKVEEVQETIEEKITNVFDSIPSFDEPVEPVDAPSFEEPVEPETSKYTWEDFDNSAVNDLESMLADLEKAVEENKQEEIINVVEDTTVEEVLQMPIDETDVTNEPSVEEILEEVPVYEESLIEDVLESVEEKLDEVSEELPTFEEPEFIEEVDDTLIFEDFVIEEPIEEKVVEDILNETTDISVEEESPVEENAEEVVEDVIKEVPEASEEEVAETVVEEAEENVTLDEEAVVFEEEVETPVVENDLFEEYKDELEPLDVALSIDEMTPEEIVEVPETTIFQEENVINLLDEVKEDMDLHNKVYGEKDIDGITDILVEEVRNENKEEVEPEIVLDADKEVEYKDIPLVEDDEEFSNTVSLEITKIMEEIPTTPVVENPLVDVVEEPTIVVPVVEEAKEEENAVEIKNLNEIDIEPAASTVSSTIPFIVNSTDDDEIEDEEDDEEEGSNTILNIILIILIIVLIIVLGLIIFYILKTKGII